MNTTKWQNAVKELQCHLGTNRTGLARLLEVSVQTVWRWELGKTEPRPTEKRKLDFALAKVRFSTGQTSETGESAMESELIREALKELGAKVSAETGMRMIERVLEQLQRERVRVNSGNVARFQRITLPDNTPTWVFELYGIYSEDTTSERMDPSASTKKWRRVYELGRSLLALECPTIAKRWVEHMVAVAALQLGLYEEAIELFRAALTGHNHPELRPLTLACMSAPLTRLGRFDEAIRAIEEALVNDPTFLMALWNGAVISSIKNDATAMKARFGALKRAHPAIAVPGSDLSKTLMKDADMANFRNSPLFAKLLPDVARAVESGQDPKKWVIPPSIIAMLAILGLTLLLVGYPAAALAFMIG